MTEPENFIARWSRRKREVKEETRAADSSSPSPVQGEVKQGAPAADASEQPGFDVSQLPSLESITAETDIRAFLAPGVPADLARAALRRAWATDPKIRDFVGLAENAWDFNAPDAMAGFGPLEMTDGLRRLVSDMVGRNLATEPVERPTVTAAGETLPLPIDSSTELPAETASTPSDARSIRQTPQEEPTTAGDESRYRDEAPPPRNVAIAAQHNSEKDEVPQSIVGRSHGRALPK
jgi:Protein of unknown function (DUF3306)